MADLLLLGGRHDPVLAGVARHFRAARPEVPVRHYRLEDLASARWTYRLGNSKAADRTVLPDGHALADQPVLVLNRLRFEPSLLFTAMTPADRDYARTEFLAFLMSWIAGMQGKVVNRATARGLAGPALRPWQWLAAAHAVGLPPYPSRAGSSARRLAAEPNRPAWIDRPDLLSAIASPLMAQAGANRPYARAPACVEAVRIDLIGGNLVDPLSLPEETLAACCSLARSVSADTLSVTLGRPSGEGWHFLSADAAPADFPEPALRSLCRWLATLP